MGVGDASNTREMSVMHDPKFQVLGAAYGALANGDANLPKGIDATGTLQALLPDNSDGIVLIDNDTMGGDPAYGFRKHFGAVVVVHGQSRAFACQEGQTINFSAQ